MPAIDTNIKTYTTTTGDDYQVNTGQVDAASLARLDELAATGQLDKNSLVSVLTTFPKSYTFVGGAGAKVPPPDEGKDYDRPPFGDIQADMNAVQLLVLKTFLETEQAFRKSELVERKNILANAAKQCKEEKDAADHRRNAGFTSSALEIGGGAFGAAGSLKAGLKIRGSFKAGAGQSTALKSIDAKQGSQHTADTKLREKHDQLDREINTEQSKARRADKKADDMQEEVDRAEADHRLYQAAPGRTPSPYGRAAAQKKQEQQALRKEAAGHRDEAESRRADKRDLDADHEIDTMNRNRDIDHLHMESKLHENTVQETNASARNWTAGSQALSALFPAIGKAGSVTETQNAEYTDAEAKFTGVQTQLMTMKQESLKSGADNLARANDSATSACNSIEQSRGEYSKSVASSLRA